MVAKLPDMLHKSASDCGINQFQQILSICYTDVSKKSLSKGEIALSSVLSGPNAQLRCSRIGRNDPDYGAIGRAFDPRDVRKTG